MNFVEVIGNIRGFIVGVGGHFKVKSVRPGTEVGSMSVDLEYTPPALTRFELGPAQVEAVIRIAADDGGADVRTFLEKWRDEINEMNKEDNK